MFYSLPRHAASINSRLLHSWGHSFVFPTADRKVKWPCSVSTELLTHTHTGPLCASSGHTDWTAAVAMATRRPNERQLAPDCCCWMKKNRGHFAQEAAASFNNNKKKTKRKQEAGSAHFWKGDESALRAGGVVRDRGASLALVVRRRRGKKRKEKGGMR